MSETVSASVPISFRWKQELVDDGKGGENFYVRLTAKADRRGLGRAAKINNLMTVIQKLKREKSSQIQKAAKYGMEKVIKAADYRKEQQRKMAADYAKQARREEVHYDVSAFSYSSSNALQKAFEAEYAANKNAAKGIQFEKEEKEEKEQEEIYYIK